MVRTCLRDAGTHIIPVIMNCACGTNQRPTTADQGTRELPSKRHEDCSGWGWAERCRSVVNSDFEQENAIANRKSICVEPIEIHCE
jgi:hypothetical protein